MGLRAWLKALDDRASESEAAHRLQHILERLLPVAIVVLLIVLYLEFFTHLPHHQHEQLIAVQKLLLAYFVVELVVDLGIHRDNRAFIRKRWLDIMLVLPFFAVLSTTGRLLRSLKIFKVAKPAKSVKAAKGAKAAKSAKAAKGAKVLRTKNLTRISKEGTRAQHGAKALKKAKEIIEEFLEDLEYRIRG